MKEKVERVCDLVDAVLCAGGAPGRVVAGVVRADGVLVLAVAPSPRVLLDDVRGCEPDLAAVLGGPVACDVGRFGVTLTARGVWYA